MLREIHLDAPALVTYFVSVASLPNLLIICGNRLSRTGYSPVPCIGPTYGKMTCGGSKATYLLQI
jgi:hypothetical protein